MWFLEWQCKLHWIHCNQKHAQTRNSHNFWNENSCELQLNWWKYQFCNAATMGNKNSDVCVKMRQFYNTDHRPVVRRHHRRDSQFLIPIIKFVFIIFSDHPMGGFISRTDLWLRASFSPFYHFFQFCREKKNHELDKFRILGSPDSAGTSF